VEGRRARWIPLERFFLRRGIRLTEMADPWGRSVGGPFFGFFCRFFWGKYHNFPTNNVFADPKSGSNLGPCGPVEWITLLSRHRGRAELRQPFFSCSKKCFFWGRVCEGTGTAWGKDLSCFKGRFFLLFGLTGIHFFRRGGPRWSTRFGELRLQRHRENGSFPRPFLGELFR